MAKKKAEGKPPPRLLPTLKYLDGEYIAAAVLEVYFYNQKYAEPVQGFAADADEWVTHGEMRRDIFKRARDAWCLYARKDFTWFPYSEDYVVRLYARIKKKSAATLKAWDTELKEARL